LTVNQDRETFTDDMGYYFEFLADSMPLVVKEGPPGLLPVENVGADGGHYFVSNYYPDIGYKPALSELEQASLFHGYIRRLVFDPNSSCPGCA